MLSVIAIAAAGIAFLLAVWLAAAVMGLRRKLGAVPRGSEALDTLRQLDERLAGLEETAGLLEPLVRSIAEQMPYVIQHTGVVAYDAFGDITGRLSRSIALLSRSGDGLVISVFVGRAENRFYTKLVRQGRGVEPLSPEEEAAIRQALGR